MCLSTITNYTPKPEGIGYKVFMQRSNGLYPLYRGGVSIPIKQWIKANIVDVRCGDYYLCKFMYKSGFHIFSDKPSSDRAKRFLESYERLYKVRYRGARVLGKDNTIFPNTDTIVADEMFVIGPVE